MTSQGGDHLRSSLRRFGRFIRAEPDAPEPDDQEPVGPWEHRTDARLLAIERTLAAQNRLLVLSVVGIIADLVIKLTLR